jgi:hypothetical protein
LFGVTREEQAAMPSGKGRRGTGDTKGRRAGAGLASKLTTTNDACPSVDQQPSGMDKDLARAGCLQLFNDSKALYNCAKSALQLVAWCFTCSPDATPTINVKGIHAAGANFSRMLALETSRAPECYPELCLFDVDRAVERLIPRCLFSTPNNKWDNVATKLYIAERCMLCKLCPCSCVMHP